MMARYPKRKVIHVIGRNARRPPKPRMSTSSSMACITEPAPRNMLALKKPCVTRWKIAKAAPAGPRPAASII